MLLSHLHRQAPQTLVDLCSCDISLEPLGWFPAVVDLKAASLYVFVPFQNRNRFKNQSRGNALQALEAAQPGDSSTESLDFSLNFLWMDKNIAVAVDQVVARVRYSVL